MRCIVNDSIFASKQRIMGCGTLIVHGLYPTLTHSSKKSHVHCDSHTPVNGIDLPVNLFKSSQKVFPVKGTVSPHEV